ncbi:methylthioribulose 1-phosphate dehydratase [Ketobacter sp. MCCC 1A13808]|uniref:methylthioribulose 1-phosphate dehydratase n=1 Tax=Ketobacter sp. MCCC 1A13808 TaxID=2602738 RepID=UPI0012EBB414|nr:methylthioribulose 1-phosphate dehydratase [Ketobacter sp. MCCC 1A13808]MVF12475.1 methylthioribulose 1-phosphate dehydratase [Ketobacter sp. MCCC 1A13808]
MADIQQLKHDVIEIGRWVDSRNWCPATSGNLSAKIDESRILITVSGHAKGALTEQDLMEVDAEGQPFNNEKQPSAETLLHALIYGHDPQAGYVIHTHSIFGTVFSRAIWQGEIRFKNYEMQKAFRGVTSHEQEVVVPVFANSQDMMALAKEVNAYLTQKPVCPAFILAGHGIYTWGNTVAEVRRHSEAMEFLMECEYQSCLLLK